MKRFLFPAAAAFLIGSPAFAGEPADPTAAAKAALADRADLPATPPTLPDQASDKAKAALENTAFRKKGDDAARTALDRASQHGSQDAVDGRAEAATRSAQGAAASAAKSANADSAAAAGQARAAAARTAAGVPTGSIPTSPVPTTTRR